MLSRQPHSSLHESQHTHIPVYVYTFEIKVCRFQGWKKADDATKFDAERAFRCCGFDNLEPASANNTMGSVDCKKACPDMEGGCTIPCKEQIEVKRRRRE